MKSSLDPLLNFVTLSVTIVLLLCAAPVGAATLTVTSAADSGTGSLRAAIASANAGDLITFATALAGQTIHLTSGELSIGKNLVINATAGVTIDAGRNSRIFEITAGTVVLAGLTLTNGICPAGNGGGGILVDTGAALTLNSMIITGCAANNNSSGGGICVFGGANLSVVFTTVSRCTATNGSSGGGLNNSGNATLEYCTLTGNTSGDGGGIYNSFGPITLSDCTLAGNYAETNNNDHGTGGGIENYGTQAVTLNNCTVSGNSAHLGGGIYNPGAGELFLTNTIVAGNPAFFTPADVAGYYAGANNFIGGDPKLAPLGNYGGATRTMQPLSGSPVIDAGTDAVTSFLPNDQRLLARLSGAHVDIGAVEKQFSSPAAQLPVLKNVRRSNNQFQFAFTNAPNVDFTALTSTNPALPLTNWTVLGNVTEMPSGQYQFTDTSAANPAQFYRVVSP